MRRFFHGCEGLGYKHIKLHYVHARLKNKTLITDYLLWLGVVGRRAILIRINNISINSVLLGLLRDSLEKELNVGTNTQAIAYGYESF